MSNVYLNSFYWIKLTFSKLCFSKSKKFISRPAFGKLNFEIFNFLPQPKKSEVWVRCGFSINLIYKKSWRFKVKELFLKLSKAISLSLTTIKEWMYNMINILKNGLNFVFKGKRIIAFFFFFKCSLFNHFLYFMMYYMSKIMGIHLLHLIFFLSNRVYNFYINNITLCNTYHITSTIDIQNSAAF